MRLFRCFGFCVAVLSGAGQLCAAPARIIILRHAEKLNRHELCNLGMQRAQALANQFLGKNAAQSLFADEEKPEAFLAITPHTAETITPAAQSWNVPVTVYKVEDKREDDDAKEADLTRRTQEAAHDVLSDPRYDGKIVVMAWEHKHIAKSKLEKENRGDQITLRQLLRLDQARGAPKTWPGSNYDYFWIVDYAPGNPVPIGFRMVRQTFTAPFDELPANDWDEPEPDHIKAGCRK